MQTIETEYEVQGDFMENKRVGVYFDQDETWYVVDENAYQDALTRSASDYEEWRDEHGNLAEIPAQLVDLVGWFHAWDATIVGRDGSKSEVVETLLTPFGHSGKDGILAGYREYLGGHQHYQSELDDLCHNEDDRVAFHLSCYLNEGNEGEDTEGFAEYMHDFCHAFLRIHKQMLIQSLLDWIRE